MAVAVVAEKPSVARDIAAVLGATSRGKGYLEGNGYLITWAVGHLVGLAEPDQIDASWKPWRLDRLPMLPRDWPLKVLKDGRDQFEALESVLKSPKVERVVCATDAGREGELIFRHIYKAAGCTKPVERLWISSLTPDAIRKGFEALRPSRDFDGLGAAAEARSRADWLVGMNFSRAYTLRFQPDLLSVGRVQTPTLAMLVEREKAIEAFVPEEYCEVVAGFEAPGGPYSGVWFDPNKAKDEGDARLSQRLPPDGALAEEIRSRCTGKVGEVVSIEGEERSMPPPLLYDLTELQRHANRLFGMTAKDTLAAAQALYEKHKLLSYPRTDSRHLSNSVAWTLAPVVSSISAKYGDAVAQGTGTRPLSKRYVDDAKVTDHHAIIPTGVSAAGKDLGRDEARLYDLVCRRLLMAWHQDHRTRVTRAVTLVRSDSAEDRFRSSGTVVTQVGWKALDLELPKKKSKEKQEEDARLPDGLAAGQKPPVTSIEVQQKKTSPPRRFTDATLLTAMESAGRALDNHELEEAMRERGLGTPATRAAILETLLQRGYVERHGKSLRATAKGIALIDVVHDSVKSPALTGEWELKLKQMERGDGSFDAFMREIERYVIEIVGQVKRMDASVAGRGAVNGDRQTAAGLPLFDRRSATGGPERQPSESERASHATSPRLVEAGASTSITSALGMTGEGASTSMPSPRPTTTSGAHAGQDLDAILRERFGFDGFRPHQEEVCRAVAEGANALLVMPTGSGKSLCYQLPGLARGGTTLVISPLIALMEDQTAKLQAMGLRAERIHSGRSREESRAVCRAYLDGELDFLAIAPERLSVPGFPEMLARRKPTLVAVDEAHCISHWGHDFRPDYRLLGDRLPLLQPAPVLALTATATVRVQDDILQQLGIKDARRFIHGFRRENLAIEAIAKSKSGRLDDLIAALDAPDRLPAIVYVPTRKQAEEIAQELGSLHRAAAYHAGLDPSSRGRTQERFIAGELDVIVATIAFGMGIDKADIRTVIHMALPGTLEGYYQEIGSAGRDGKPSRALLLYSYGDRKLHESFLGRDYQEPAVLGALLEAVPADGIDRESLAAASGLAPETFEPALDKLWINGGVTVDADDVVRRGKPSWRASYEAIRRYRVQQLDDILDFAQSNGCRMVRLVRHFGETRDTRPCGHCDACKPKGCVGRRFRPPSFRERAQAERIIEELERRDGLATGTLYRSLFEGELDRRVFESLLDAMERAGAVSLEEDAFEKEGKTLRFRRVKLKRAARSTVYGDTFLLDAEGPAPASAPAATKASVTIRKKAAKPGTNPKASKSGAVDSRVFDALREWRRETARARGIPAFRILTDQVLNAIAAEPPANVGELRQVRGMGPKLVEKYGGDILGIVSRAVSR